MALGRLQNEGDLERWTRNLLDRIGIGPLLDGTVSSSKILDGTIAVADLSAAVLSKFVQNASPSSAIQFFMPLADVGAAVAAANFTLPWSADCFFICNASGYDAVGGRACAYDVLLDGGVIAHGSHFFNPANTHMQLGSAMFSAGLAAGVHSVQIQAGFQLSRDNNDRNSCLVIARRNA